MCIIHTNIHVCKVRWVTSGILCKPHLFLTRESYNLQQVSLESLIIALPTLQLYPHFSATLLANVRCQNWGGVNFGKIINSVQYSS